MYCHIDKKKRAQASGAAGLISLILLLILLYIMFLPPADRAELLGEGYTETSSKASGNNTIFSETLGRVDYLAAGDFEKTIPNIYLEEKRDAAVLKQFSPVYIKNGVFDKKQKELEFTLENIDKLYNIQLVFAAKLRKGILSVELNSQNIFEDVVTSYNILPVNIDKPLLKSSNKIKFSVSGVGLKFWATNEYSLEDVKIIGMVLDESGKKSDSIFTLSATEFFNVEESKLRFIPYCGSQDVGKLTVSVNNKEVYSSIPVCDDPYTLSIPNTMLNSGINRISFATERGSYSVEQIKVLGSLKDSRHITRFIDISEDIYDDIREGKREAWLVIDFVDDSEHKEAELSINGHRTILDQRDRAYSRRISSWIVKDSNYITITPLSTLYIVGMKVNLS